MATDPFTLVYSALWDMLEANAEFADMVKVGNRIRFDIEKRGVLKPDVSTADLPEVILTTFGGSLNLIDTSSSSKVTRFYQIVISTGDLRLAEYLNPLEWAIFRAMVGWRTTLGALRWKDKSFVKRANVTTGSEGESDPERNRGIKGWSALWTIEVEMHFATADLAGDAFDSGFSGGFA